MLEAKKNEEVEMKASARMFSPLLRYDCVKGSVGDVELVEIFVNVVNVTLRDETLSRKGWRYFTKLEIHKKILGKLFLYREEENKRHLLTFSQNSLPPLKRNCSPGVTGGR